MSHPLIAKETFLPLASKFSHLKLEAGFKLSFFRCGLDSPKPSVDLESADLISRLFRLFHGTPADSSVPEASRRRPAGPALGARLMALFTKSIAAANCAPQSFQVFPAISWEPKKWRNMLFSWPPRASNLGLFCKFWHTFQRVAAAPARP